MSDSYLKYMIDSPLFKSEYVSDKYSRLSDSDLERELQLYRDCCLRDATLGPNSAKQNLSVLVEGFDAFLPAESLLKQCALYVEDVIINDPVFEFAAPRGELSKAMNLHLGMKQTSIDRKRLSDLVNYMNRLRPAIQSGFVKFLPISHLHEPAENVPIRYSENWFADVLPGDLLEWFRSSAELYRLWKGVDGWYSREGDPLLPCRAIGVHFKNHPSIRDAIYFLYETEVCSFDEKTGKFIIVQTLPDDPPSESMFAAWIFQSVNQAAKRFFDQVHAELRLAACASASYLTRSPFVAELLRKGWSPSHEFATEIFNAVLKLDLPVLENVSFDRIIDLRQQEGEVFQNFRSELERHLRDLRNISDPEELEARIQSVRHELSEVRIAEIDRKIAKIKRAMLADAIILGGGLVATIQTNGLGILALVYGLEEGYKTFDEYLSSVKDNPMFFLWKLGETR